MRRGLSKLARAGGLAVAVAIALGPLAAAPAGAKTRSAAPARASATPAPRCTLSASLDYSSGEQASCIAVGAKLSRVPAVGQTATLTVTVEAQRAEPNVDVAIDLPPTIAFADGTATNAAFDGNGRIARAHAASMKLAAGQRRTVTRVVRAAGTGFGEIRVTASDRVSKAASDGGTTSVFLTTGAAQNASFLGSAKVNGARGVTRAHVNGGSETPAGKFTPLPAAARPARQVAAQPATAGQACVTGTWNYVDQNSVTRAANDVTVTVKTGSTTLASGFTSPSDASYNLCWSTGGATQTGVFVQFIESNSVWTLVTDSNAQFVFGTGTVTIPDGGTQNFGNLQPADGTAMRGLHAYQEANDEYQWIYRYTSYTGGCWSPFETTCRQLVIHWQSDSTTGTFWNNTGAYLLAGSPDTLDEPVHEYGHALMYNLYGQSFPATTNCGTHDLFVTSSTTCGWTEGWADWVATSVYNNMVWTYNGGFQRDMNVTWNEGFGYPDGDQVEARIVQAMRSLTDGIKAPWDNDSGEGSGTNDNRNFFAVLHTYKPNTFADFWNDRASAGQDVSQTALGALYQGTIDYGFRNPLTSTVPVHFPEAVPDHNYSATASSGFWSLVAVKPDLGSDVDLSVFSDFNQTALVGSSAFGGTTTDFVGINTNAGHLTAGAVYPRVHEFAGTGGYTIESIAGSQTLSSGTATPTLAASQPATVYDSFQNAGTPMYIRAVPAAGQDVQVNVLSADQNAVGRGSSAGSVDPGVGNAASLVYNPTASGWHGLVLLENNTTAGAPTLYVDTTGPTGTVTIAKGAAKAPKPTVGLTLSASDTQTGVMAMQISTDGTFDTEPVVAYSTTAKVKLPGNGNGTKTVSVRYQNNAGEWSTPVTDTIDLESVPVVTSITPNVAGIAGGNTVTIKGTYLGGVTAVKFGTASAASFHLGSATKITAVVPAHGPGTVNVTLTNANGNSAPSSKSAYTYQKAPAITSVTPATGPHAGGTTVTIVGTSFNGASAVQFGSVAAASFTVVSNTKITAVTPAHAAGQINVRVTTPAGQSVVVTGDHFKFT